MERSAGVVLKDKTDYLLLKYEAGHWDFPKGHLEKGETDEEAALRELKEETGLAGVLHEGFSHTIAYAFQSAGKLIKKEVVFFIATSKSHKVVLSNEHVDFVWLPYDAAMKKLTYNSAKEVLKKAHDWLEQHA